MNYDRILIRYGEISTKGKNRNRFINQLKMNIKESLTGLSAVKIEAGRDRMHIYLQNPNEVDHIISRLKPIFGIQSFSPVVKTAANLTEMKEQAVKLVESLAHEQATFKVSARRADKSFPLDTNELNREISSYVLNNVNGLIVEMKNPEIELVTEVREEGVYLSAQKIPGAGGMPIGASNKASLMLSGGLDSPVAGFHMMKRGVEVEAIHFHSPPFTSEQSKQKVRKLAAQLAGYSGRVKLHIVPFTAIQQAIQKQVPENYTMTSTRRMMLKIADVIRENTGSKALVTGESLGQVASQTLESMQAINAVTATPVLRPLITMDKTEIIEVAKEIGTYDLSILPYEDCCTIFTPASPKTKPKLDKVVFYESFIDFELLIQEAVNGTKAEIITPNTLFAESSEAFSDLF
ncbi:tRNA uracil 4-sulfurtransferase ThiI [Jeotgalibacillus campisalis]|uniref:Probable tRNA sulfurtransferase n=1 Tax=Jeotgalibacillus campisalis TaxID=220754 RepID=A0A0C2VPF7_9BACL|nr:tRNA uracil 4-sulfurtransferase ThiI [Jeotgalibacillus campisalis]KIL46336.1 thiamine biosynthesis protein ThiI [Jeotgalibacillus campisalis]